MYRTKYHINKLLLFTIGIFLFACNEEYPYTETPENEMPLRQVVGKHYGAQNFYIGMTPNDTKFFDPIHNDYRVLFSKEFAVLSIDSAFFQSNLLKDPREQFSDVLYRPYFTSARRYNMYIYAKAGLSDNTSDWLQDENDKQNNAENIKALIEKMNKQGTAY